MNDFLRARTAALIAGYLRRPTLISYWQLTRISYWRPTRISYWRLAGARHTEPTECSGGHGERIVARGRIADRDH